MTKKVKLALIGFGNVGQGLTQILAQNQKLYQNQFGIELIITAICTRSRGSVFHPDGLNPQILLDTFMKNGSLHSVPAAFHDWSVEKTILESNADVIVEASITDLQSGEPALGFIQTALKARKHVVTTNKGPIALHYQEIQELADGNGVKLGYEGTVMCGTPSIHLGRDCLMAAGIKKIEGIINGTTNYILCRMEQGADFQSALKEAQTFGYAEADPTADIEGHDAAAKALILAKILFRSPIQLTDVKRQGISHLTPQDIADARQNKEVWKLIATIEQGGQGSIIEVSPRRLPLTHPLAQVSGTVNAITFSTDLLGQVTLIGPGAGKLQTGYAVLLDILDIYRSR